jgi:hypothetical protein
MSVDGLVCIYTRITELEDASELGGAFGGGLLPLFDVAYHKQ